jgi:uncharacterized protein YndB with AHSA1/START domain
VTAEPSGRVLPRPDGGCDLVVQRTLGSPPAEVWATLTEPDHTARWFGIWKGESGEGRVVHLRSGFEDGMPWSDVLIRTCRPSEQLDVEFLEGDDHWLIDVALTAVPVGTRVTLTHHLSDPAGIGDIGPGWEYYLDMFVAAHTGAPLPSFDDYHPAQSAYFTGQSG